MKKSMGKKLKAIIKVDNNGVTGQDIARITDTVLDHVGHREVIRNRMELAKEKAAKIVDPNADVDHQDASLPVTIVDPPEDHAVTMAKEDKAVEKEKVPASAPATADVCRETIPELIAPLKVRERAR
jgi:hypothetical protein